jgi:hypothetical protein
LNNIIIEDNKVIVTTNFLKCSKKCFKNIFVNKLLNTECLDKRFELDKPDYRDYKMGLKAKYDFNDRPTDSIRQRKRKV